MHIRWVDRTIFNATSAGLGDFVVASAVQGYLTPAQSGALDGEQYHYAAQILDGSGNITDWEVGTGTYNASTTTLARTSQEFSSNSNNKVNFSTAPQIMLTALADDFKLQMDANTTFYVSTTGNNSNTGLSTGQAWRTLQYALDFLSQKVDGGGFSILIQIADGTYAGACMFASVPNLQQLTISGNQADQTKVVLTDTGNVNAVAFSLEGYFLFCQIISLTIKVETPGNDGITIGLNSNASFCALNYADITFTTAVGGNRCTGNFGESSFLGGGVFGYGIGTVQTGKFEVIGNWFSFAHVNGLMATGFVDAGILTMTGATFSGAFYYSQLNFTTGYINFNAIFAGSVTGKLFHLESGASLSDKSIGWASIGGTAGGDFIESYYNGAWGADIKSGPPVVSDLASGGSVVFKDSTKPTGLGVVHVYNDAGTLVRLGREILEANFTLYVATTGNDNNPGTLALPFATAQHAYDVICETIDLNGFTVTIQMANGSYTDLNGKIDTTAHVWTGGGNIVWQGNLANQTLVSIDNDGSTGSGGVLRQQNILPGIFTVQYMSLSSSLGSNCIRVNAMGVVVVNNVNFGAAGDHLFCQGAGANLQVTGTYSITGNAVQHLSAFYTGSLIGYYPTSVTAVGTINFSSAFAVASDEAMIDTNGPGGTAFIGTFTGRRFSVANSAIIDVYGAGVNFFPGNVTGEILAGGQYDTLVNTFISDTAKNILNTAPINGLTALASDYDLAFRADGTQWLISAAYWTDQSNKKDLGWIQFSDRVGYGKAYVTDKLIANCQIGEGSSPGTKSGQLRWNPASLPNGSLQVYNTISASWENIVDNLAFREATTSEAPVQPATLQHNPVGFSGPWINVFTGDSEAYGLNGLPLVQGYRADMGAYPAKQQLNGGTF